MEHRDDHILVVKDDRGDRASYEVLCPYTADPQRRRLHCGVLDACGCQAAYEADRAILSALSPELEDDALELHDWVAGCYVNLAFHSEKVFPVVTVHTTAPQASVAVVVADHEKCPHHGVDHHIWEGEVMVPGTSCGYQEQLDAFGPGFLIGAEDLLHGPGRYVIHITWSYEEFEIDKLEKVDS